MSIEETLIEHYGGLELMAAIEAGLERMGKDRSTVTVEDLGPVDEFHIGGRAATSHLCGQLPIGPAAEVLDVGCGIGGTSRYLATATGCRVTGIDLSPAYVAAARALSDWVGVGDQVRFVAGSALDTGFADGSFDAAVQLHVGMNVDDKAALFAEVARVLRPGGKFGIYDVVRQGPGELRFPTPWASSADQSFVVTAEAYREALVAAGFSVTINDRRAFAIDFFEAGAAQAASAGGPPPLGLHLIIEGDNRIKLRNLRGAVLDGIVAPMEFICELG